MKFLISAPPNDRPRFYIAQPDNRFIQMHDNNHITTRRTIDLLRAVWPGRFLGAHVAQIGADLIWYAPRNRSGALYVSATGSLDLHRYIVGGRPKDLEEIADKVEPQNCHVITLQPLPE